MEIIGFDGTLLSGPCGQRMAIRRGGDGRITTKDGRELTQARFEELATCGYITKIDVPIPADFHDGVCVYVRPNVPYIGDRTSMLWRDQDDFLVCYVDQPMARRLLDGTASAYLERAEGAVLAESYDEARDCVRKGLASVTDIASSGLAAKLYAVLMYVETRKIDREMGVILNGNTHREALLHTVKWLTGA